MKSFIKTINFIIVLLISFTTYSQYDPVLKKALVGEASQFKKDSFVLVRDTKFDSSGVYNLIDTPYNVKNIITLKINEASTYFLKEKFSATVNVRIIYKAFNQSVDSISKSLTINYDPKGTYKANSSFIFSGAHEVTVKILSIDSTVSWNVTRALVLENALQAQPHYKFDCTSSIQNISFTDSAKNNADELFVSWNRYNGASQYDLEWTYIDSSAVGKYNTETSLFGNNATRVSVSGLSYSIPLIYDNSGILFFRIRPVQEGINEERIEGKWTAVNGSSQFYKYDFKGHQGKLNWQSTTSFAEDGKRKVVVQYFDGSLRSRQTVTKDNTTNTTVVSETFYDFQGRPTIQVLPSPTLNTIIEYSKNFNIGINGEYDKISYDSLYSNICDTSAPPMVSTSGASQYYSTNNPQNIGFNKYIPQAQGYPFTQTRYTQDNTGRISSQSGVGWTHKLAGGHDTKYFYGTPDQSELDALFGTEVGEYSHYFKNMVRDANGQYSISYVDMHGRTVATALAGTLPADISIDKLASNINRTITETISNPKTAVIKDLVMESKKGLLVSKSGMHQFSYSLNPESLVKDGCTVNNICYDCLYDLRITITDDCNNQKLGGKAFDTTIRNFSLDSIDNTCNAAKGFSLNFSLYLGEGSYDITKELSISKYGMSYYRDSVFMKNNACKTLEQFIKEQRDVLVGSQCQPVCESCRDSVGTWDVFRTKFLERSGISNADSSQYRGIALTAFNEAIDNCRMLCDSVSENDAKRQAMLLDMTPPNGQYANPDKSEHSFSLFHIPGTGLPTYKSTNIVYHDELGKPDSVYDPITGIIVRPQDLTSEEFSKQFKLSWATDLLKLHPEYNKLVEYEKYSASNFWDKRFAKTETYTEANNLGYLNPTANIFTGLKYQRNVFFKDPLATYFQSQIESTLASYINSPTISLWSMATIMTKCEKIESSCINKYNTADSAFSTSMCDADLNMAWKNFRQLYLQVKQNLIYNSINSITPSSTVISNAGFSPNFNNAADALTQNNLSYLNNTGSSSPVQDSVKNSAGRYYQSNCLSYAKLWVQQLAPCSYDSAVLADSIIPKLVQVCIKGSNNSHPYGSSSISPDSSYTFNSFEAVIDDYNSRHSISDPFVCNPELINAPKPYDQQSVYGNKPVWDRPDTCECNKINSLYAEYKSFGSGYSSFSDFLKKTRNTNITDGALDTLRSRCNTSAECKFLLQPILLPPALQCYSGDICITCAKADSLYQVFKLKYPTFDSTVIEADTTQQKKNLVFSNFMNNRLGFAKDAWEYLEFLKSCKNSGFNSNCAAWDTLISNFKYSYSHNITPTSPVYDTHGCDSSVWKYPHLEERWVPLSDIISNGVFRPNPANDEYQDCIHFYDSTCVDTTITFECRIKEPKTGPTFTDYGSAYSFWITLHSDADEAASFNFYYNGTDSNATLTVADLQYPGASNVTIPLPGNYDSFRNIKIEMTSNKYKIYFDGQYVGEAPHLPIHKFKGFYFQPLANSFEADWVHIADNMGNLILKEEFDNCSSMAHFTGNACKQSCEQSFTTFYNNRYSTQLTYNEIKSLHASQCNDTCLNVCTSCISAPAPALLPNKCISCDKLQVLINSYFSLLLQQNANDAGTDSAMVSYIQQQLHADTLYFSEQQIRDALNSCGNSWKKNVAYKYRGKALVQSYPQGNCVGSGNFSVEAWVYPTTKTSEIQYIVQGLNDNVYDDTWVNLNNIKGYRVYLQNGKIYFHVAQNIIAATATNGGSAGCNTIDSISTNKWHHIVVERIGNHADSFKIYVDGVLKTTELASYTYLAQSNACQDHFMLGNGSEGGGFTRNFDGLIKNLRIYTRNIESSEVLSNYNCTGLPTDTSKMIIWDKLDEGTGTHSNYSAYTVTSSYSNFGSTVQSWNGGGGPAVKPSCLPVINQVLCNSQAAVPTLYLCGKSEPVFPQITLDSIDNCSDSTFFSVSVGTELYRHYQDSLRNVFDTAYRNKCLQAYKYESFTVTHTSNEYHYTLYYYDQAGNLVKTVPPEGVKANYDTSWLTQVKQSRINGISKVPDHTMLTQYRYNTLNQVINQVTTDAGESQFWYDRLGRLAVSQNAKQKTSNLYSYTLYDDLGRINEVGEITSATLMTDANSRSSANLTSWLTNAATTKTQITKTEYDKQQAAYVAGLNAKNLRNRVASTALYNNAPDLANHLQHSASFYSYDIHGNVDTLLQDYKGLAMASSNRFKKLVYRYDLISGKVNHVAYQPGQIDAFYHRYSYDAENRLVDVETSRDSSYWEKDAFYQYYKHGPLARAIIGQQQVQGVDYAYTLQGWLKGVNTTAIGANERNYDMGRDGGANSKVARDAFGFGLYYYASDFDAWKDYQPISTDPNWWTDNPFAAWGFVLGVKPMYNGNISATSVHIPSIGNPLMYKYTYDQLNRIKGMTTVSKSDMLFTNNWSYPNYIPDFNEAINYDANGNILNYVRNGTSAASKPLGMDNLTYHYKAGTNKLDYISDVVNRNNYTEDIDDQNPGNYQYDAIGNLIKDQAEGIQSIEWTVYGKIKKINKTNGSAIVYSYDPAGNRISKSVISGVDTVSTFYVRDAQGNVLSLYRKGIDSLNAKRLTQTELHLYGSNRLGIFRTATDVEHIPLDTSATIMHGIGSGSDTSFSRGFKQYELTNHLGNVMVTVSDKKKSIRSTADTTLIAEYEADVITANDYYPFGMPIPGRSKYETESTTTKEVKDCINCAGLQSIISDYFQSLDPDYGGSGNEQNMLAYIQSSLNAKGMSFTTAQIQAALSTCNNSWKKNVALRTRGYARFQAPQLVLHTENFTVEAWAYVNVEDNRFKPVVGSMQSILGTYAGFSLGIQDGYVYFHVGDGYMQMIGGAQGFPEQNASARIRTVEKIDYSKWHHIVAERVGNYASNFKIYVDGVLMQTEVADYAYMSNGDIWSEYSPGSIYVSPGAGTYQWGFVKNVRMYRKVMSGSEVQTNYNSCTGTPADVSDSLLIWGKFDEGSGTVSVDHSSYQTNGEMLSYQWHGGVGDAVKESCITQSEEVLCGPVRTDTVPVVKGYRYGFNGKEKDNDVKGIEGSQQDYGMRIYDPRVSRFLSVDPIAGQYPELTPYQFASNRPLDGIDLDGLEWFKKDNTKYRLDYKPVLKAPNIREGLGNTGHNAIAFVWNGTLGAVGEMAKGVNNYLAGGYKESPSGNAVQSFNDWTGEAGDYHSKTPFRQQFRDFGNAATDLNNYELAFQLVITHKLAAPKLNVAGVTEKSAINLRVRLNSADAVNKTFTSQGYYAPYAVGTTIGEFEVTSNLSNIVRLSGPKNVRGNWFTTMSEIKGLTPAQMKSKFSLKHEPTQMTPVSLNEGSTLRVGTAAPVKEFNANGGGFQIELLKGDAQYGTSVPLKK